MNITGANNYTMYFENGEEVFPCRCGETHRGADVYTFGHHNCFHNTPLMKMQKIDGIEQAICPDCGELFELEDE